ncbi:hypothetical protein QBC35DRAFT_533371 [Podospora australis]|uniref:Uncharacterized protein n=1 Tax=Podospora australis TaxID=1536484 RepID=A0AAN6WRI6_9PEZI|nr:hypothetical protein QBC35DRAFT_533371 [Podospora australis]
MTAAVSRFQGVFETTRPLSSLPTTSTTSIHEMLRSAPVVSIYTETDIQTTIQSYIQTELDTTADEEALTSSRSVHPTGEGRGVATAFITVTKTTQSPPSSRPSPTETGLTSVSDFPWKPKPAPGPEPEPTSRPFLPPDLHLSVSASTIHLGEPKPWESSTQPRATVIPAPITTEPSIPTPTVHTTTDGPNLSRTTSTTQSNLEFGTTEPNRNRPGHEPILYQPSVLPSVWEPLPERPRATLTLETQQPSPPGLSPALVAVIVLDVLLGVWLLAFALVFCHLRCRYTHDDPYHRHHRPRNLSLFKKTFMWMTLAAVPLALWEAFQKKRQGIHHHHQQHFTADCRDLPIFESEDSLCREKFTPTIPADLDEVVIIQTATVGTNYRGHVKKIEITRGRSVKSQKPRRDSGYGADNDLDTPDDDDDDDGFRDLQRDAVKRDIQGTGVWAAASSSSTGKGSDNNAAAADALEIAEKTRRPPTMWISRGKAQEYYPRHPLHQNPFFLGSAGQEEVEIRNLGKGQQQQQEKEEERKESMDLGVSRPCE